MGAACLCARRQLVQLHEGWMAQTKASPVPFCKPAAAARMLHVRRLRLRQTGHSAARPDTKTNKRAPPVCESGPKGFPTWGEVTDDTDHQVLATVSPAACCALR